jgi:hypothetical protein
MPAMSQVVAVTLAETTPVAFWEGVSASDLNGGGPENRTVAGNIPETRKIMALASPYGEALSKKHAEQTQ